MNQNKLIEVEKKVFLNSQVEDFLSFHNHVYLQNSCYIKKRWQEYTEELYKRNLMTQITMTV